MKAINPNTFITGAKTLANQQYNDVLELAEIVSNSGVDRLRIGVVTDQGRAEETSMLKWNVKNIVCFYMNYLISIKIRKCKLHMRMMMNV